MAQRLIIKCWQQLCCPGKLLLPMSYCAIMSSLSNCGHLKLTLKVYSSQSSYCIMPVSLQVTMTASCLMHGCQVCQNAACPHMLPYAPTYWYGSYQGSHAACIMC